MDIQDKLRSLLNQLNTVIVGKPDQIRDCVACLLAGGHLLIDDVPVYLYWDQCVHGNSSLSNCALMLPAVAAMYTKNIRRSHRKVIR